MAKVALIAGLLAMVVASHAAQVIVAGDSWGSFSARPFRQMFTSRGYDIEVDNIAIGGTTARYWARRPDFLVEALKDNPDAEWIWLTIGGNDGINELLDGRPIDDIVAEAINNTLVFLDPLFAYSKTIKVVQFGYDIVDFGSTASCRSLGNSLFPKCGSDTSCKNEQMFALQYDYVDRLVQNYPKQHTSINLLGTLQSNRPNQVPAPYPNTAYFSPESLMQDCIHPNDEGFTDVFDRMWEIYWKNQVSGMRRLK